MTNSRLVASAFVYDKEKFLFVKANVGRPTGLWNLPGGIVEDDETFDEAARRETYEETGLDVYTGKILCVAHETYDDLKYLLVTLSAKPKDAEKTGHLHLPEDEIEEARWFSYDEVRKLPRNAMTHGAYSSAVAFKNNRQIIYQVRDDITSLSFAEEL